ncbi:hypothetical protein [Pseudomonas citronellolis]|uniref:hypothetical protein n=1 Tax=Pseudomonas citronellolis TaxID=53408 RepID=UPI00108071D9|nr:hypothetical protein [Pseudomonas citronellolis]MCP1604742.1 hypothetical protein [Pseudomonas citronellolis]MCP1654908.1 hypothetical protein [Pseudomonas citronellolis]MCP1722479.1 hypothetical protein [Pseudomonas citronellolis]
MDRSDVIELLKESFAHPTSTPNIGEGGRDEYISKNQEYLIEHAIEPVAVEVYTTEWTREFTEFTADSYEMLCIAKSENDELLYDEKNKTFSLAIRNDKGTLYLVGYASSDALAEWLG